MFTKKIASSLHTMEGTHTHTHTHTLRHETIHTSVQPQYSQSLNTSDSQ